MARGRHKKAKYSRDLRETETAIAQVQADLAAEEHLLQDALSTRAEVDALKAKLRQACDDRDRACQPEADRLINEIAALQPWRSKVQEQMRLIQVRWGKASEYIDELGDTFSEGTENLLAIVSGVDQALLDIGTTPVAQLTSEAAVRIQRARGERSRDPIHHHSDKQKKLFKDLLISRIPADEVSTDHLASATDTEPATLVRRAGTVLDASVRAVSAWHPMPWIVEPSGESISPDLGLGLAFTSIRTDFVGLPEVPDQPAATMSAASRNALAARPPRQVFDAWHRTFAAETEHCIRSRIPTPVDATPRHPVPADAATLRHWYAAAAWGRAFRSPADCGTSTAHSRIAVATQAAVPFWLPPGHTVTYVDSEPLSSDDLGDLRLPYPQVFLAFADPLQLAPILELDIPGFDEAYAWLAHIVADIAAKERSRRQTITEVLSAGTRGFTGERLSMLDYTAHLGARVEGIVFLADALGRLDDEFAWCLTIPAKSGGVLGRWTLPASLERTAFRDQVINLAAVTAWGDWHRPEDDSAGGDLHATIQLDADRRRLTNAAATVRVLNVKTTARSDSGDGAYSGAQVAPHIRRGHWRRQRYGPSRSLVRRVRIAPVLVNASRGDIGHRVYRLPPVADGHARRADNRKSTTIPACD
ncbi:hypothetical protein [Nocardia nova]|uniref:hypothetical protein n=1 Tax=Nocardia nova TaxID=37330 RepID=UPI0011B02680|nr:hypothetical protein [Nocardia nova]